MFSVINGIIRLINCINLLINGIIRLLNGITLRATPSAAGPSCLLGVASWAARCLHFDILGGHFSTSGAPWGTILAPRDHAGGPWEQQDGVEMVVYRILLDFRGDFGTCLFGLVSRSFFYRFLNRHFDAWDFQIEIFAVRVLQNRHFIEIAFNEFRYRFL